MVLHLYMLQCTQLPLLHAVHGSPCMAFVHRDRPWGVRAPASLLLLIAVTMSLCTSRGNNVLRRALGKGQPESAKLQKTLSASMMVGASAGKIDASDITISQLPDGSDWLLGAGSSGQVCLAD